MAKKDESGQTWFCIATAGATIDGRMIEERWIKQAAESYDPEFYTAKINAEHVRGWEADGSFPCYGTVTELKAEAHEAGKSAGKLALWAKITPTKTLAYLSENDQKTHTSCEFDTNFQGIELCYLVGLAITDSPASVSTSRLAFTSKKPSRLFFTAEDNIAQAPDFNAVSAPTSAQSDVDLTSKHEVSPADSTLHNANLTERLLMKLKAATDELTKLFTKPAEQSAPAESKQADSAENEQFAAATVAAFQSINAKISELEKENADIKAENASIKIDLAKIKKTEVGESRPLATGSASSNDLGY